MKTTEEVTDILREDDRYLVKTATWQYPCDSVIVACGSPASNVEGSSATGYALAEKAGTCNSETVTVVVWNPWKKTLLFEMGRKPDGWPHHFWK